MPVKVMLVDDDPYARAGLRAFLHREPEVEVVGECCDGAEAVDAIRREEPDLLFLDVDMPRLDGFAVLDALEPRESAAPVVVFVTGHTHHALRAFDVAAVDYLVKPVGLDRFRQSVARARNALEERRREQGAARVRQLLDRLESDNAALERLLYGGPTYLDRLLVKSAERTVLVSVADVDWVEADGNYVRLHAGKANHLIRTRISALAAQLDPRRFVRIHRSHIVNLDRVKEMRPWFAGDSLVILHDGTELRLSRSYRGHLEALLGTAG